MDSGTGTQSNTNTGLMAMPSQPLESNSSIGSSMNNDIMSRLNRITNLGNSAIGNLDPLNANNIVHNLQANTGNGNSPAFAAPSLIPGSHSGSGSGGVLHMDSSGHPRSGTDSSKEHIGNKFVAAREPSGGRGGGLAGQAADEWAKVMGDDGSHLFNPL